MNCFLVNMYDIHYPRNTRNLGFAIDWVISPLPLRRECNVQSGQCKGTPDCDHDWLLEASTKHCLIPKAAFEKKVLIHTM